MTMSGNEMGPSDTRNAQVALALLLGGGGGAFLEAVLHPKATSTAPGGVDLTPVTNALAAILAQQLIDSGQLGTLDTDLQAIKAAILALSGQGTTPEPTPEPYALLWSGPITAVVSSSNPIRTPMVDTRSVKRMMFKFVSSLNQSVTVQLVGDIANSPGPKTVKIGSSLSVNGNDVGSAQPGWGQWYPWTGVEITVPIAPTSGMLYVYSVRKNVD